MIPNLKINLSAIVHKKDGDDNHEGDPVKNLESELIAKPIIETVIAKEPVITKEEEKISLMAKISLNSIKKSKTPDEKIEEAEIKIENDHKEKKEELLETLIGNEVILDSSVEKLAEIKGIPENKSDEALNENNVKSNITDNNNVHADLAEIEKKINDKVEEEVNKKIKKGIIPVVKQEQLGENVEMFGNYKSEFTKKENIIIDKVVLERKKFREKLKEPKTRILLVLGLIFLTIAVISAMFILDPKNNSIEIYKVTIEKDIESFKNKYISSEWVANTITIENYKFDTFTQKKLFGGVNYKYKDVIYTTKDSLDKVISTELDILKKESEKEKMEKTSKLKLDKEKAEIEKKRIIEFNKIKEIIHSKYKKQGRK